MFVENQKKTEAIIPFKITHQLFFRDNESLDRTQTFFFLIKKELQAEIVYTQESFRLRNI